MRAEIFLTKKEAPGVVWACERFHAYVHGMKFVVETDHKQSAKEYVRLVDVKLTPTALTTREIEDASAVDEELVEVRKAIITGQFEKCKQYMAMAGELCVIGQLVLRGTRIVIPKKLHPRTLALAHERHL